MAQAAVPWILGVSTAIGAAGTGYGIYSQKKAGKEAKAANAKMAQALNKPKPAAPQAGQNKGALGKISRGSGATLMTQHAGGSGGTGPGKGLLY